MKLNIHNKKPFTFPQINDCSIQFLGKNKHTFTNEIILFTR